MKIGILANSRDRSGYGRYGKNTYLKLRELGFETTDFNICDTTKDIYTLPQEESDKILLNEKMLAEQAGIEISQVHGPWRYPPRDATEEDRAERLEKMKISIRAASVAGCKNWVVHPLMPFGTSDKDTPEAEITYRINLEFLKELVKTAKQYGVTVCFENMPFLSFSLSTPEQILKIVNEIDDENLKICLDTGHVNVFKDLNIYDEVVRVGDKLKVLHVHDNVISRDIHLLPRFGTLDWDSFGRALRDIDFKGSVSVETTPPTCLNDEMFEEMSRLLVKILKEIIAE